MTTPAFQQRCWNHDTREAVCRCPGCGRSYCRECVTEHDDRLLCAACLRQLARATQPSRGGIRRLAPVAMAVAGLLLAWMVLFGAGEALLGIEARMEQASWHKR